MWYYKGKVFTEDDIGDNVAFVYLITNIKTGKKYVGKKLFSFKKTKKPLKGKKNRRHTKIASDWETYYGSNKVLNEDVAELGPDNFHREIIHLCKTKGTASYLETKEIIARDAIIDDNYYNEWIYLRVAGSAVKL